MKKRIIAVFVSVVIVALSVLTVLSGCSGEGEQVKEVKDREAFFSEVAGLYKSGNYSIYINHDGTILLNCLSYCYIFTQLKGTVRTLYQDSEYEYHTELSKLEKSLRIDTDYDNNEPIVDFGEEVWSHSPDNFDNNICYSNDIIYIFAPGKQLSDLEKTEKFIPGYYDRDEDEKLDNYVLFDYTTKEYFSSVAFENEYYREDHSNDAVQYEFDYNDYYIRDGVWIDYTENSPLINIYSFSYSEIDLTRYNISNDLEKIEKSNNEKDTPLFFDVYENLIIMVYKSSKCAILSSTGNKNKLKCYVYDADDKSNNMSHYLYHYDKIPDKAVILNDQSKANTEMLHSDN